MTAAIFCVFLIVGYAHFVTLGHVLFEYDGRDMTIYRVAFLATTFSAAFYAIKTGKRSNIEAGVCIIAYSAVAPMAYAFPQPMIWSALIDLSVASFFIMRGAERWQIYAGLCFLLSVAVSALTAVGIFPGPGERPFVFIAFSQPDITALCGHAANIAIGFGSGDFGPKIRSHFTARRNLVRDWSHGLSFMFRSNEEVAQEGQGAR